MGPCKTQGIDNVIPLTGKAGRLFSPLYPEKFPQDMECTWIITVPEGRFVRLSITSFDLGNECKNTLEIRDGQNSLSPLLGNFCSVSFDPSVFSSGRYLWVRFQSEKRADKPPYATGFKAFYETVSQCRYSFFFYHVFQIYPQFSILNGSHEQMSNSESAMNTYIMFGNFYRVMKKNIGNQGMRETQAAESITCVCVGGGGEGERGMKVL